MSRVRRRWAAGLPAVAVALAVGGMLPAAAAPPPVNPAPLGFSTYGAPQVRCTPTDRRIDSVSGIAATAQGLYVQDDRHGLLWQIDDSCHPVKRLPLEAVGKVIDTEDLAATADGSLWVADIGGNRVDRTSVSLIRVPPDGGQPVRYTLAYPDGTHDAETLLISPDQSQVVLVTKIDTGVSLAYSPVGGLRPGVSVPLQAVGTIRVNALEGRNSGKSALLVTGGAVSPDGLHVVLRTYNDAWEWDAPDGQLAAALRGLPRKVTLPVTKQGEAISYTPDGKSFLVSGEKLSPVYRISIERPRYAPTASAASRAPVEEQDRSVVGAVLIGGALVCLLLLVGAVLMERRRSRQGPIPQRGEMVLPPALQRDRR